MVLGGDVVALTYRLLGPESGVLWVALHGFTQGVGWADECRLHERVRTLYPISPRFGGNWRRVDSSAIAALATRIADREGATGIVLAGFSDGCSPIHEAAVELGERCVGLVHYSGIWPCGTVAEHLRGRIVCCVGVGDWLPTARITRRVAREYGVEVLVQANGHRWSWSENERIIRSFA